MSFGKNKQKSSSSQTIDQTQTNTLSPRAYDAITGQIGDVKQQSYQMFDPSTIAQYLNPNKQAVIDASLAQADQADAQARAQQQSDFAKAGAFGDKRRGIYEAELAGNQSRDRASLIAGLESDAYDKAQSIAQSENTAGNAYNLSVQQLISSLVGMLSGEGTSTTKGTQTGTQKGTGTSFSLSASDFFPKGG